MVLANVNKHALQMVLIYSLELYWVHSENSTYLPAVIVDGFRVARATVGNITVTGREKNNLCYASLDDEHYDGKPHYEVISFYRNIKMDIWLYFLQVFTYQYMRA